MTTHQDLIDNLMCKFNGVQIGKVTLFNCDCNDLMACIPDKAFELSCVDPPYGIHEKLKAGATYQTKGNKFALMYEQKNWDKETPSKGYFNEVVRVSKNQIIWGSNHFVSKIPFDSPCWIFWDKKNGTNFMSDGELAYTSFKTAVRRFEYNHIQEHNEGIARIHPTQKPIKLYEWLLTNYAKAGDKILDTHLGSMSSVIACLNLGFEITGSELDVDYFNAGVERVKKHQMQQSLFDVDTSTTIAKNTQVQEVLL